MLFPSAAEACDSAEVNGGEETTQLPTSTQLQMCKQRTKEETRGVREGTQKVCDKRKVCWEITGLLGEPEGSRDLERAKEEKAGGGAGIV